VNNLSPLRYEYLKKDHLKDFDIFKDDEGNVEECVQIMSHRGCGGRCEFCSEIIRCKYNQIYYNNINTKTVPKVIDEIWHYVRNLGVKAIFFDDSTFIEEKDYVSKLCDELVKSGLQKRIKWGCLNRFEVLRNEEIIKKLANAGMTYTYLGLELYDDRALGLMRKPGRKEAIKESLDLLYKYGIKVGVSLLFGYPDVDPESEEETIKFVGEMVKEKRIHLVSLSLFNYHLMSSISRDYKDKQRDLNYGNPGDTILNRQNKSPWECFEEGGWFHAFDQRKINEKYLWQIWNWVDGYIKDKSVLVRKKQIEDAIKLLREKETEEGKEEEKPLPPTEIQLKTIVETEKDWVRVCLVQLDFSVDHVPPPAEFAYILKEKDEVKKKVFSALEIAKQENVNIICFPELSFDKEWVESIKEQYKEMIIVGGSYYENEFNTCPIIIEGEDYYVQKAKPSPGFEKKISGRGMKCGRKNFVFQTRYGKFVVLICFDYQRLVSRILDASDEKIRSVDFIIVPEYNKDIDTFQTQADADCRKNPFPYILQVNAVKIENVEIGGTCIFGMEHKNFLDRYENDGFRPTGDKYKLIEAKGEMMIIVNLDIERKGVPVPASRSKMEQIKCYVYKNGIWVEDGINIWL